MKIKIDSFLIEHIGENNLLSILKEIPDKNITLKIGVTTSNSQLGFMRATSPSSYIIRLHYQLPTGKVITYSAFPYLYNHTSDFTLKVFIHELAHLNIHLKSIAEKRKIKPHGVEYYNEYKKLIYNLKDLFSQDFFQKLNNCLQEKNTYTTFKKCFYKQLSQKNKLYEKQ